MRVAGVTRTPDPLGEPSDALVLREAAASLLLCHGALADDIGAAFLELLDGLGRADGPAASRSYARAFRLLADADPLVRPAPVGDAWQNHLLDRLLADENPFSRWASLTPLELTGESTLAALGHDMAILRWLHACEAPYVAAAVARASGRPAPPAWRTFNARFAGEEPAERRELKERLAAAADWGELVGELHGYWAGHSPGVFGEYSAFRWRRRGEAGWIEGVARPDPITLEELVGYERERAVVVDNTQQFVASYPANNILLYGDRGTGKSSTVKALLHRFGRMGLRLVEVGKHDLGDFTDIVNALRDRPERFILFIDDLSFDEHETHYKELKAVLEGGLETRPSNVLLYATTNRRHLVQERFSDRPSYLQDAEIHAGETRQEKLSLADRFGITVTFVAPDQDQYLEIVRELAGQRAIALDPADLMARALRWSLQHNGRSGRTARQFVDQLAGELWQVHGRAARLPSEGP